MGGHESSFSRIDGRGIGSLIFMVLRSPLMFSSATFPVDSFVDQSASDEAMSSSSPDHGKSPTFTNDEISTSESSSSGSNSTPTTPPSPIALMQPQSMIVEPQITEKSPQTGKRSPPKKSTPPQHRLGAIDEDTDVVSPDLPKRNPRRTMLGGMQHNRLFQLAFPPASSRPPPPKIYDDIEGPKGEKFVDVRNNTVRGDAEKRGFKKIICLVLVFVILGAIIAIILIAVLLTRKKHNASQASASNNTNTANQVFPAGNYAIASFLTEADTACTSNDATWQCYPYKTYNQSATASLSTLSWVISTTSTTSNTSNANYTISSTDTLFTYPFQSRPLTLENKGTSNEAYTFSYPFVKTVFPSVALTSDGSTTRCYFNNTLLTGVLYTKRAKEVSLTMNSTSAAKNEPWPYALEFYETISTGSNVPNCYKYVNGVDGAAVDIATSSQANGECRCQYQNYGV